MAEPTAVPDGLRDVLARTIRTRVRLTIGPNASRRFKEGNPVILSGREADDAADAALTALAEHGLVVVARADLDAYVNRDGTNLLREVDGLNALLAVLAASEPR